jgi:acetylglutamate kinase
MFWIRIENFYSRLENNLRNLTTSLIILYNGLTFGNINEFLGKIFSRRKEHNDIRVTPSTYLEINVDFTRSEISGQVLTTAEQLQSTGLFLFYFSRT